jgi:Lar family restriction alleviation protein
MPKPPEPKLKPCPFCGGPAIYWRSSPDWEPTARWAAGCENGHAVSTDMETKGQAAVWWNTRRTIRRSQPT